MSTDSAKGSGDGPTKTPQARRPAVASQSSLGAADARINILICDDEPKNLAVLETILDDPQYRLVRAVSADEALLALVGTEQFAVLILDIRMPGMTGFELAQVIKARRKTARVPIIFVTAYYSEDQHVLEGYDTGAVDYLNKPINPAILRSKVAVFAELHRKSRDATLANEALIEEINERRRAEEQLRELNETLEQRVTERTEALRDADRLKDEFLAMLGHELRNPLAAVGNAVDLMHASGTDAAKAKWALGVLKRQTENLRRIVDDLLDVARVSRGRMELQRESVDVAEVVARAVDSVRPHFQAKEHEPEIVLPAPQSLRIEADPTRLEQAVVNLLLNANKFTPPGRGIAVTAEAVGDEAVITVRDEGIGIGPELLPHVFELFTQADRSLDRTQGGLGIGLHICRQIAELHGGSVSAKSAGLGQGAEFAIRLPGVEGVAGGAPLRPASAAAAPPKEGEAARRVLVVDDNVDSAQSLSWLLGQYGHDVAVAYDGATALKAAHEFKPDVLMLDIGLPIIDGYELARRLRADGFPKALFIAISGYAQKSDVENSRAAGFDLHFAKPVEFADLLAAIGPQAGPGR